MIALFANIYKGQKGVKRKAGNPLIDTNPLARDNQNTWDRQTPVKCRKCLSIKKIHICTKRNSVQNIVGTLNRKGLSDTIVSTILRQRGVSSMSNVIPLLGYGNMPMKVKVLKRNEANENNTSIVTRDEIIQLQRELNLTNDRLHTICQLMKHKGLRTPNTRYTQILKKNVLIYLNLRSLNLKTTMALNLLLKSYYMVIILITSPKTS